MFTTKPTPMYRHLPVMRTELKAWYKAYLWLRRNRVVKRRKKPVFNPAG